jgi:hypothetical protein
MSSDTRYHEIGWNVDFCATPALARADARQHVFTVI